MNTTTIQLTERELQLVKFAIGEVRISQLVKMPTRDGSTIEISVKEDIKQLSDLYKKIGEYNKPN